MLLAFLQIVTFLVYLNANVINVGKTGAALPVLAIHVIFSMVIFGFLWLQRNLYVRLHFFLFLMLISWIFARVIIDLGDLDYLKSITIATSGGIILFYILGALLGASYQGLLLGVNGVQLCKIMLVLFFCLLAWMQYNFQQRLHPTLFFLTGGNDGYQRSGDFLSISFILASFLYLLVALRFMGRTWNPLGKALWLGIYLASVGMGITGAQLLGSNSATAVIAGVSLITVVMVLTVTERLLLKTYLKQRLSLPWSKCLIKRIAFISLSSLLLFALVFVLAIQAGDFDISTTRLFGFGAGTNTSLVSRYEILVSTGVDQLSYAPFLGNINVAYLTTGNSGRTLHSLFPYVMANLGLVGFIIVIFLFVCIFMQLIKESKHKGEGSFRSYRFSVVALYSFLIFLYLVLFANLSVGISWAVLWFALGFISRPLGFKN